MRCFVPHYNRSVSPTASHLPLHRGGFPRPPLRHSGGQRGSLPHLGNGGGGKPPPYEGTHCVTWKSPLRQPYRAATSPIGRGFPRPPLRHGGRQRGSLPRLGNGGGGKPPPYEGTHRVTRKSPLRQPYRAATSPRGRGFFPVHRCGIVGGSSGQTTSPRRSIFLRCSMPVEMI